MTDLTADPVSEAVSVSMIQMLNQAWEIRRSEPRETVRLARLALTLDLPTPEESRARLCLGYGLLRLGEFAAAQTELTQALDTFTDAGDLLQKRTTSNTLGMVQCELGQPVAALQTFLQVRQLSVALGLIQGEIEALNNVGSVYVSMGNHPGALESYLRSLRLSQQHELRDVESEILNNLSVEYYELTRYDDALEAAQASLDVAPDTESFITHTSALALHNAARACFKLDHLDRALDLNQQALAIFEKLEDQAAVAEVHDELGRLSQHQRRFEEAEHFFRLGLQMRQQIGDLHGQAESMRHLGGLQLLLGQTQEALDTIHAARATAGHSQAQTERCAADLALADAYRQAGQFREGFLHLEQHLLLKEELFNAASDQRVQSLQIQFELERAEQQRAAAEQLSAELQQLNSELERTHQELTVAHARTSALLEQVEQQANQDALTGLANRRAFDSAVERLQPGVQMTVVIGDIDHFKQVNDQYSHLIGDEVLRQIAGVLGAGVRLRQGDLLARFGGEEFVILMVGTDAVTTERICERLRLATERHNWGAVRPGLRVTISLGAAVSRNGEDLTAVLQAADHALYEAKANGRNRVVLRP
ncbi:tetratricopeptide repeat-containing diguanylate cyclase [Deinococcus sp. AJ005]|uniref:tetratricopeptide repeat-containing diguanylate cyclase n=1 Tax=Deinococcus sp. AJ005 TaxID=2652443 RepID=UPI00125CB776|nr:tetratricopeptide repeat-containing diguanylate cyclase [Deinococcus sp. AJ005]QFP76404.1 GGDEF domain-containing protein [Deinococcus sp. AJ005]